MKVSELFEDQESVVSRVLAAAKAATNVRGASLGQADVDDDTVVLGVLYDFPEHKVPSKDLNAKLKGVGRASVEKSDRWDRGFFAYVYYIELNEPLSADDMKKLKTELKQLEH